MAGTTFELVVLSSSPPPAPSSPRPEAASRRVAMGPLSPLTSSPPASPGRPTSGASETQSRAATIPEGAVRGFATVNSLIRSEHFTSRLDDDFTRIQQVRSKAKSSEISGESTTTARKPQRRPPKKPSADDSEKPKPKPRARKPKADTDAPAYNPEPRLPTKSPFFGNEETDLPIEPPSGVAPNLTKSGKPRKPRAKKAKAEDDGAEGEAKPKRTRVAKPKKAVKDGKTLREDASVVSAHFPDNAGKDKGLDTREMETRKLADTEHASIWDVPQSPRPRKKAAPKPRPPAPVAEDLDLEEAVLRRRDWTPPRDTTVQSPFTDSVGKENKQSAEDADGAFTHLISNFAYAHAPSAQPASKPADSTTEVLVMTKRRRVELLDLPNNQTNSRDSSPEKGKAPKKKPRTITDLVTGQYAPKDAEPESNSLTSNFFEPRTAVARVPLNDMSGPDGEANTKKQPRKRTNAKSGSEKAAPKAKSKKPSAKAAAKPKPVAEKLLSPASALTRLNRQDVLFGTSSQLALEESPTMLRQLQHALKDSEQDTYDMAPPRWPKLGKVQGKKGLWAASARDDEGGVLEHMEDVYIPEPDRTQDIPLLMDGTNDKPDAPPPFVDIDDFDADPVVVVSSDLPTPPRATSRVSQHLALASNEHRMHDVAFEDIDSYPEPPPSNQNVEHPDVFADIHDFSPPLSTQTRSSLGPKFNPPTSTTTNGSPKKRRGRPPKVRSAIPSTANSPAPQPKPSVAAPKKIAQGSDETPSTPPRAPSRFIDIDEILDSEDEALGALSPTPPRMQKLHGLDPLPLISLDGSPTKKVKKPATTKALADATSAPIHRIPSSHLEWPVIKPTVFAAITSHIRSLPPSANPKRPTWHERILMYDPLVLEDFTAYLNTHTNIRTWKKATQKQIKAWNAELKIKGEAILQVGERGDEILAITKELEASMVQGWCESLSVCCIWGEGKGKGGVRKGFY